LKLARHFVVGLTLTVLFATGCGTTAGLTGQAGLRAPGTAAARMKAADEYYAPVAGKTGRELLLGLNRLVSNHKDLGYGPARDVMFGQVDDLDNDNKVECVYIGRELERVTNAKSAFQNGSGLNAEHTWPQSKGAEGVAKSDLHHLYPADAKANGVRGHHPFGEVKSPDWEEGGSVRGTDAQGNLVFQPRPEHRGNVARAILYFYTVYGVNGHADLENFRIEEEVLKRWHEQDPVNAEDRARNEAVLAAQGNRNPYVDHPEFVKAVGNFLQAGSLSRR
jgi:endonuclease I